MENNAHAPQYPTRIPHVFLPRALSAVRMPTLEVRGLKKSIDGHGVLKDVSFGLQDGELAAILGPSGGGKTTLFRCILGELTPEAGKILIDGQEVGQLPTERRLLDEAFGSLDATMRTQVVQEVRSIIRQQKVTTLFITHDQEEAFMFARRLIVLNEGRVVASGTPESMMTNPDPFVQDFMKM